MKNDLYLVQLHRIEIDEPLGKECELVPGMNITNNFRIIEEILTDNFRKCLGALEYNSLKQAKVILYAEVFSGLKTDSEAQGFLIKILAYARNFLHSLWMLKDNAVGTEMGFARTYINGREMAQSNFFSGRNSTADGKEPTIKFSRNELRTAIRISNDFLGPLSSEKPDVPISCLLEYMRSPRVGSHPDLSRLTRALYFLSSARSDFDPGMKLVQYFTVLETLFSTDSSELSHKLSQRIALFLGNTSEEKIRIFTRVKKLYGYRSKVVHGDVIKGGSDDIFKLAIEADEINRRIFNKIYSSPEIFNLFQDKKEALEDYFLKTSLGCPL